jgi:hypothetical protein
MSAALTPIIPMSREEIIYLDFFFFCRRLRIRPVPFGRWLRLSEGRDWYEETSRTSVIYEEAADEGIMELDPPKGVTTLTQNDPHVGAQPAQ